MDRQKKINDEIVDRFYGSLIGLAVGDALGAPLEFKLPGSFRRLSDMKGGGKHHLEAESGLTILVWHFV